MRLNVQSLHLTGILADWIVIPRSRSAGRKSVVVLPVSTDPGVDMNDDLRRIDSVRVVFPESAENEHGAPKEYLAAHLYVRRLLGFAISRGVHGYGQ
jgi:3',5'-cyclic AMP phosphodiesterase CpdA